MRILLLEDSQERRRWFRAQFAGNVLDETLDPDEAVRWLRERAYDYIYLDHDLSDEQAARSAAGYCGPPEATGYAVALWLAKHPECQPDARIVIHSLNELAARRMGHALREGGRRRVVRIPFLALMASAG